MQKVSGIIILSLAATVGAATLVLNKSKPDPGIADTLATNSQFDSSAATEQRILALEAAVSSERQARQLLEDELMILFAEIERLEDGRDTGREDQNRSAQEREARGNIDSESVARKQQIRDERRASASREAMLGSGISAARVDYILRRESELRFESMQAMYEARNSGAALDPFMRSANADAMLREELGDTEYELYLKANNRQTSVGVSSVMASSPAERAGLQAGDEIVGYDGRRVFSTAELIQRTMAGGDGSAVVDVTRNGSPLQIVVPRGPIGVEIGRFRGR